MKTFIEYLTTASEKTINTLKYFYDKEYCSTKKYAFDFVEWTNEVSYKNKFIHMKRNTVDDKECVNRKRGEVFWIDFGVNIGSEFNFQHFCIVIKEFHKTAIVIPLSSVKENDSDWKSEDNLVVNIGIIEGFPEENKEAYAMVNQIKTVSKQRLSNYKYKGNFIKIKVSNEQMDLIDSFIIKLTKNG